MVKGRGVNLEVLREDLLGDVRHPVRDGEGRVFGEFTVVEDLGENVSLSSRDGSLGLDSFGKWLGLFEEREEKEMRQEINVQARTRIHRQYHPFPGRRAGYQPGNTTSLRDTMHTVSYTQL